MLHAIHTPGINEWRIVDRASIFETREETVACDGIL